VAEMRRFTRKTRNTVATASDHGPPLGEWLRRIEAIEDEDLTKAIDGIWCGRSGEERIEMAGTTSSLCVGWHDGRVEWSYIS
jgi:hypothetical protein